jgi:fructokinase
MRYAVVVGESLIDLVESRCGSEPAFRPLVGGAPLNVAVGLRRLGVATEFVGSVSGDRLGHRIWDLLTQYGVGTDACTRVDVPTTLALTGLHDGVPEFTFYGDPPSFALLDPERLDRALVAGGAALYCGSIALMYPGSRETARAAWSTSGPLKVLDPNVRPRLLRDRQVLRATVEEFAATADLVKLSAPDADILLDLDPVGAAAHLQAIGARAVVVTLGPDGAILACGDIEMRVPAPTVDAVDTTGAGDACTAALMYGLLTQGLPAGPDAWRDLVAFAVTAAALSCEVSGGATAMPTLDAITARLVA